jgi:hypothetical protein
MLTAVLLKETIAQPCGSITLDNEQLGAQIFIYLLQSSTFTCFQQYLAHPQKVKLY